MRFLLRTLSLSYVRQHKAKTFLTLLGVVVGVATFSAIAGAQSALVSGIRRTVDRMAGKAQLQITLGTGVPEELQETLRDRPAIRAQAPVIEQVVVAERPELGTLLVLGVDLLGDREMRDYGFEGQDADLDDPLLFLAQPDSIALSRTFAERAGLKVGDSFSFRAPQGVKRVVVRGLLTPKGFAESFGGNLAVTDVYAAQELFGRGRRFDRLEVRLADGVTLAEGTAAIRQAVGPGYKIETPARRGAQMEQLIGSFVAGFNITSGFALGIGTFLIFNAFTVSVNRRRRDIGTLRALGATPRQVGALFLLEAVVLGLAGGLIGLLLGVLLSRGFLTMMGEAAEAVYGVRDASSVQVTLPLVLESMGLGLLASLAGALFPARAAARVRPTEALAKGTFSASVPSFPLARVLAGAAALAIAIGLAMGSRASGYTIVLLVVPFAIVAMILLAGPLARLLLRLASPAIARLSPVSGRLSADALLGNPRRTSGTVTAMTISLAFVLGTAGYMGSTKAAMERWMRDILTSDLYLRGSANFARPDYRYPGSLREELLRLPLVRAVESYRAMRLEYRGDEIVLATVEMGPVLDRTRHEYLQGDPESLRRGLTREGKCAVSDNFYRRYGLGVGDVVELPTPTGVARFPIAAVTRDFTSDKGTVSIDRSQFLAHWKDDRVDTYDVSLKAGADAEKARAEIQKLLAGRMPALVSTSKEFMAEISRAIDAFYVLTRITVFLALAVAFLGIVTSLLISVAERTREIGILKSLGALGGQIRRSVAFEAIAVAMVGLALSIPLGNLVAHFLETTVAEAFAGWRMPHAYPTVVLLQLAVALPTVSALAAWLPARQAAAVKVTEAIEYE